MKKKPIRVLQCVNIMDRAGLETMLMNYYRNIDKKTIQFDFVTHRKEDGAYDDEIRKLGGKVYHAPRLIPGNYIKYFKYMKSFFKEHPEYRIIHSHIDSMSYFPLKAAYKNHVPIRISHSHSSKLDKDIKLPIKYFAKTRLNNYVTHRFACGKTAGKFLYRDINDINYINNAIDTNKFLYNEMIRKKYRKELNIDINTFVVGHVGRFIYIKNQMFLIDIFNEIIKQKPNSILLLIGKGPDEKKLRNKVNSLGLQDKVMFLIDRNDVNNLYQVMDIFVMPSLFEGVPVVGIEAQSNGLKCFVSSNISNEILITSSIKMLDLKKGAKYWAEEILLSDFSRNNKADKEILSAGYNIKTEAIKLQNLYLKLFRGDKS